VRVAAIGDLHCRIDSHSLVHELLGDVEDQADVLVIAGDLTDTGLPDEAKVLMEQLSQLKLPVIATLGNHDHESGKPGEVAKIFREGGICLLDGTGWEIDGVGFAGTKGFSGGFGQNMVMPFGEAELKTFILTGINEAIQLEKALINLKNCSRRMAVLHYSPVRETLLGESPEIFAFLGTSRLASAIDTAGVDAIVHGHAHHGSPLGKTLSETPVYNVSRYVQRLYNDNSRPYCLIDL